ncbi:type II toxin-antitoxin system PemK/MazF family toxin [Kitasatospora sp. NPDC091207]|uniref:type II toxin-antitoxin system PemK/MazF family toxin n=1 Tax=Kitasatospora sp. NPDC091207 TaxID=3364083 RepID=UPI003813B9FE
MTNYWWLALWTVAATVGAVVGTRRRARRPARRGPVPTAPPTSGPRRGRAGAPAPQEIWWAKVPFEDGPGAKDRPCLVLRVNGRTATVAKITSKHHADRPGVLSLPPGSAGDRAGRSSWLETDELRDVPLRHFRRRAGTVDRQIWDRVQQAVNS